MMPHSSLDTPIEMDQNRACGSSYLHLAPAVGADDELPHANLRSLTDS